MSFLANLFLIFKELNWVDFIIIAVSTVYIIEGYSTGFLMGIFDAIGFIFSFVVGLKLYKPLGDFLSDLSHIPNSITHIISFIIAAIAAELILRLIQRHVIKAVSDIPVEKGSLTDRLNRYLGIIPGLFSGIILTAFFLTVLIVFPVIEPIKGAIGNSKLGTILVSSAQGFEQQLTQTLGGGQPNDLLTFFTIEPEDLSLVDLHFKKTDGIIDNNSEQQMFDLVNSQREKNNLQKLMYDEKLRDLARAHSQDMLARGYFGHYTPDGKSPFDRMNDAGIFFSAAGENLALSADVSLAMQGLMQSPGHRANILSPNFRKIGIGVIDAGIYGKMFSQEFTD